MGCQLVLGLVALLFMSNIATGLPTPKPDETPAPTTSVPDSLLYVDENPAPTTSAPTTSTSTPTTSAPTTSVLDETPAPTTSAPTTSTPESPLFQIGPEAVQLFLHDGEYETIQLQQPFVYAGKTYSQLYLSMDGYVAFSIPNIDDEIPNPQLGQDIIAPLWTDIDIDQGGRWTYEQTTNGSLLQEVTDAINMIFPDIDFSASWVFVSTWENVPLEWTLEVATLQVILVSNGGGQSYVLMNYATIPSIPSSSWLAGINVENSDFDTISVSDSSQLSSTSNINVPGLWAFLVSAPQKGHRVPENFYPVGHGIPVDHFDHIESSSQITLQQPFQYFGSFQNTIYVNKNGVLSFSEPRYNPDSNNTDIIAPLWTHFETDYGGKVIYEEITDGLLLSRVTQDINTMFPEDSFYASWLFIVNWEMMSFLTNAGNATFQAVLVSDGVDTSYIILNYGGIDFTDQYWQAGYKAANGNSYFIPEADTFNLSSSSNVHIPGRWVFEVGAPAASPCQNLNCTLSEVCRQINGVYGCACGGYNTMTNNPDIYGASETCSGSIGSLSLSRCQLFEAGYSADVLHLNDPSCKGEVEGDQLVFKFDSNDRMCATTLTNNGTHIIFKNNVGTTDGMGVISHVGGLNIAFSCVYPLIQSISMPMAIQASSSVVSKELSTEGSYMISMIPYPDSSFYIPYSGNVTLEVNQQLYIAVEVDQFDSNQIALVLDNCWATPVNQSDYSVRWDLIVNECPNPADGTVAMLQNGISTSSRFSFRMFTFTSFTPNIYLHCQVHLCLLDSGNCAVPCDVALARRRRSADFYDSAAITMGL